MLISTDSLAQISLLPQGWFISPYVLSVDFLFGYSMKWSSMKIFATQAAGILIGSCRFTHN